MVPAARPLTDAVLTVFAEPVTAVPLTVVAPARVALVPYSILTDVDK